MGSGQLRYRRLEDAVQGGVHRQFVEAAGENIGSNRKPSELAGDVEPPAQQPQILRPGAIAPRQPASHGGEQSRGEQADEQLQQIVPLRAQRRHLAFGHAQIPRHGEHPDQRHPHGAVVTVDLGQDFQGGAGRCQNAHNLTGPDPGGGTREDRVFRKPEPLGCAFGDAVQPFGVTLRETVVADAQLFPLADESDWPLRHAGSEACCPIRLSYAPSGKSPRTVQR